MHTNILLEERIEGDLQELGKFGLCSELNHKYRRVYNRLKKFAQQKNWKLQKKPSQARFIIIARLC